jgi:hypothetical protein
MTQAQRKLRMRTTIIPHRCFFTGVLRRYDSTKVIEAPSVVKSFNEENGTSVRLIRPTHADYLLVEVDSWREVLSAFSSPVDMVIAYKKPNQKIGDAVVFADEGEPRVILATTGNAKGEKDVAILVPDITADDVKREGNDYVIEVPQSRLVVVPDFPAENGWYKSYKNTTVPYGTTVSSERFTPLWRDTKVRYLYRRDDESYVNLLVRSTYLCHRCIEAIDRPSRRLGVAVEVSEGDVAKINSNNKTRRSN